MFNSFYSAVFSAGNDPGLSCIHINYVRIQIRKRQNSPLCYFGVGVHISTYTYIRPKKKYCLFPISDRLYQNMCDPNLFYGFPKKKKKKKNFFFFFFF